MKISNRNESRSPPRPDGIGAGSFDVVEVVDTADAEESRFRFDPAAVLPSTAVVSALSVATGVAFTELEPLYDVVDAEALDCLLAPPGRDAGVSASFELAGHEVTAGSDGRIAVRRIED